MDFDIYFCNDGILRARYTDHRPMVPLKFIQEQGRFSDLSFWVRWWENSVYFEKGLTLSKFLLCLEPWKDFWSEITLKDVSAYIEEVRKPILVGSEGTTIDWIDISYLTEIEAKKEFLDTEDDESLMRRDFNAWINSEKNARLTGHWDINSHYKVTGYKLGEDEHYSIDYSPMNELANIPIILNDQHILMFQGWSLDRFFEKDPIFKKNAFGICSLSKGSNKYLYGKKYHRTRDVIEGFFWWLFRTPVSRDGFVDSLKDSMKEFEDYQKSEEISEKITKDKIVSLEDYKNKKETKEDNDSDDKKMEVKIAPGAFSSMIDDFERNGNYWDDLIRKAKKEKIVLKIGNVKTTEPLENRIYNYVIKSEDVNSSPKATEYKKI